MYVRRGICVPYITNDQRNQTDIADARIYLKMSPEDLNVLGKVTCPAHAEFRVLGKYIDSTSGRDNGRNKDSQIHGLSFDSSFKFIDNQNRHLKLTRFKSDESAVLIYKDFS